MSLALLLAVAPLGQLPVVVDLPKPGTYYLQVQVDAAGTANVRSLAAHKPSIGPTDPTDPTDPDDPPTPLDGVAGLVKTLTADALKGGAEPFTAAAISRLHEVVGQKWIAGEFSEKQSLAALDLGYKLLFRQVEDEAKWSTWSAGVDSIITTERQKGSFSGQTLLDVSVGVKAAGAEAGIFKDIDWEKLLAFIIKLIALFGGL